MSQRAKSKFRLLAGAFAALAAAMLLVACGSEIPGSNNQDVPTAQGGPASGSLTISNWPLYIDGKTIDEFSDETGIDTTYTEDVNDNNEFFGKVSGQLRQGSSGGRDIIVVTDWMAEKMWKLGYIQKLNPDDLKTVRKNMIPSLQHPSFDPDRTYSVPWQSGMTGLVVRKDLAPDVHSINDLFDPQYKGKVTMLTEMRDTVPLVMKADGIEPKDATTQDWLDAIDKIKEASDSGQIRRFTGNDFVQAQADNPDIEYRQPTEGCSIWSDNMLIPVGAPNTPAAYKFMNYVYEPKNQAQITAYVNYVSPVKGVKEILEKSDPEIANNELIFPSDEFVKNCFNQVSPPGDEEEQQEVERAFQSVVTG